MSLLSTPFDPAREAALVTGAGNGIGRAIAQALVGEGVRTVFADISEERVTEAVKSSPRPELAIRFVGDLAKRAVCDALLAHTKSRVGLVTHSCIGLAAAARGRPRLGRQRRTWQRMHAVNLDAGFHLARELSRKLIAAK